MWKSWGRPEKLVENLSVTSDALRPLPLRKIRGTPGTLEKYSRKLEESLVFWKGDEIF